MGVHDCGVVQQSSPVHSGVKVDWDELARTAWLVRGNAFLVGKTAVGCAVLSVSGKVFTGCNVEHRYRCHDIHAEVNAIGQMVAAGERQLRAVMVVAQRERFTPCGSCMDWVFQFGDGECLVAYQDTPGGRVTVHTALELMPFYPR